MTTNIRSILKTTLTLVCAALLAAACGSSADHDATTQPDSYTEYGAALDITAETAPPTPQTPQLPPTSQTTPPETQQPEIVYVSTYTIEDVLSRYQDRNDEILADIWAHIARFEGYFSSIYIPIPDDVDIDADNAQDVVGMIEGVVTNYVIGEILGGFGTAADVITSLFNAGEQASSVLAAHVVEGVIPFTTALNYIYQKGYVTEADLSLAQDAFGNFMQRVGAVHGTGANARTYLQAHNQMLDLYSEFHANTYIIDFIQSISSATASNSADIAAISDDITYALSDYEVEVFLNNAHRRISAFPLNFDETRAREIERTYGLAGAFLGALPFFGLFDNSQGVSDSINQTSRFVFGNLTLANNFATRKINPHITQLNVLQQTFYQRASFLQELLANPQYYPAFFAALAALPQEQRARTLSFDDLLNEFGISARLANNAMSEVRDLLGLVLTNAEFNRHNQQLIDIGLRITANDRGAIFSRIARHPSGVNMRQHSYKPQELQNWFDAVTRLMQEESAWLQYDLVMDMRFRPSSTNMSTTDRSLSQGRYYIETTRNQSTGQIVMIREFENTGTVFRTNHVPRWTTLYRGDWEPVIIMNYRTGDMAIFGGGEVLYASDNWQAQINAVDGLWYWPIYEAIVDLIEQHPISAPNYLDNLRRRGQ